MKTGLQPGHRESITIYVAEDMCPSFGGDVVHPVLSTVTMVYYMEWVSRLIILPFLEPEEEGIGTSICITHMAPAPIGKEVTFFAEASEVHDRKVVCKVWAEHDKAQIGEGVFTQIVKRKSDILQRIEAMR
ncbi:thioesterase family protein [Sulfoacidibacillus thermotolerans]|uniref:Thioesterase n=1 Tax=Sulfoacidibacillus thermotolerans TaxID=1765684 RepID=A0A2U3D796_SULT2|nr:thioesterase [Sulfoacidibacillus thermotolerans]PWI57123.1 thioesterase [Sulfoacidibacillus thermotolerans]